MRTMQMSPMARRALLVAVAAALPALAQPAQAPPPPEPPEPPQVHILTSSGGSFLGVGVTEITAERAKALSLREERGVEITKVDDDSPASKGGLKAGDVVLEYNGQRIEGTDQFVRMVRETPAGREVKMTVSRGGQPQTVAVKTAPRTSRTYAMNKTFPVRVPEVRIPEIRMPEIVIPDIPRASMYWRNGVLGVEAESLEPQLASYFGVSEGVLVRSVNKDTPAEKAGLKAGDVILKVDDTKVTSPRDVTRIIRDGKTGKRTLALALMRDRKETSVSVTIEDPDTKPRGRVVRQ